MKFSLAVLLIFFPGTAFAETWGDIQFIPRESFWDEENEMYFQSDTFKLLISDLGQPNLKRTFQVSCHVNDFFDGPPELVYEISIAFEGPKEMDFVVSGETFEPVKIVFPGTNYSGTWGWVKFREGVVSGMPKFGADLGFTYWDVRNTSELKVEALGQVFMLNTGYLSDYFEGFERMCNQISP